MSIPREPRQKMINIMYLVLTALLALNVASEILNAFKTVDNSLKNSNGIITASTNSIMNSFKAKVDDPASRERSLPWYERAQKVQTLTNTIYSEIDGYKRIIYLAAGADSTKPFTDSTVYKEDDLEAPTRTMVKEGRGEVLRQSLINYRNAILNEAKSDDKLYKELLKVLPIDTEIPKTKNKNTWSTAYFNMTPAIAALTILSKFQNDVKNTENKVIAEFHQKVGFVENVFDAYSPIANANATYVLPGQKIEVTAGVGAFNSNSKPTITIAGRTVAIGIDGVAKTEIDVTGGTGQREIPVSFTYTKLDGQTVTETKKISYTVGSPTGIFVSAEKVKVLYINLENEIAVSGGSGVGGEKINASIDNGVLEKTGPGKYIARPTTAGEATITVVSEGKSSQYKFKVKRVPDPVAVVGGISGGKMKASEFRAQTGVAAILKDFVFDGISFKVSSFTFTAIGGGVKVPRTITCQSNIFNSEIQTAMAQCTPGTIVYIDEIRAVGPGGESRKLNTIAFNLTQ